MKLGLKNSRLFTGLCMLISLGMIFSVETALAVSASFEVTDVKMCQEIDANRRPVKVTSNFPKGTEKVYCWFAWKGANPKPQMVARWHYVSEDIHILDSPFTLTRVADSGVLSLKMPPGKPLPSGEYRLDLEVEGKVVKSLSFQVLESDTPAATGQPSSASPQPEAVTTVKA